MRHDQRDLASGNRNADAESSIARECQTKAAPLRQVYRTRRGGRAHGVYSVGANVGDYWTEHRSVWGRGAARLLNQRVILHRNDRAEISACMKLGPRKRGLPVLHGVHIDVEQRPTKRRDVWR